MDTPDDDPVPHPTKVPALTGTPEEVSRTMPCGCAYGSRCMCDAYLPAEALGSLTGVPGPGPEEE